MDLFTAMNMEEPKLPSAFYNTTAAKGATLKEYTAKATAQDARVLDILATLGTASPSQVWIAMSRSCPITSVRRALTGLTKAGKARKMEGMVMGEYGRPEHTWKHL